jgi:uncharacterized protein YndB with AHSA1/START domain
MTIKAHVKDRVLKPPAEVFSAIVDSDRLVNFFPSSASGPLRAGETVTWNFADVGGKISVSVKEIRQDRHIAFEWSASGQPARVDIDLQPYDGNSTLVTIIESDWPMDQQGVERALRQTQGWTDFLCCMKAYLQFGVHLREGRTKDIH